jgi:hypothetical protein
MRAYRLFVLSVIATTALAGQAGSPEAEQCNEQYAAYDQVRLRAMASQTALELLRDYRRDLDQAYEATREPAWLESHFD